MSRRLYQLSYGPQNQLKTCASNRPPKQARLPPSRTLCSPSLKAYPRASGLYHRHSKRASLVLLAPAPLGMLSQTVLANKPCVEVGWAIAWVVYRAMQEESPSSIGQSAG